MAQFWVVRRHYPITQMQILKILAGIVSFLLAGLSLVMFGLLGLAWWAQYSNRAANAPASSISTVVGPWTLLGWQNYAVASLFIALAVTFILVGVYALKPFKSAA